MDIEQLINDIHQQDFVAASSTFAELMQQKLADSIDQEKIKIAGQIFNGEEDDTEDEEDLEDVSDEEIDEIIDEDE